MESQIFRKKSLELLEAPEDLNDYLHVTRPAGWMILLGAVLVLAGLLLWAGFATFPSFARGEGVVKNETVTVTFGDSRAAEEVKSGMVIEMDDLQIPIQTVGFDEEGRVIASGQAEGLADGVYSAKVTYKTTQVLNLLFENS